MGGTIDMAGNLVTACCRCHSLFDRGCIWAAPAQSASPAAASAPATTTASTALPWQSVPVEQLVVHVVESAAQHSDRTRALRNRPLTLPAGEQRRRYFPPPPVWEWRQRWAHHRRERWQQTSAL